MLLVARAEIRPLLMLQHNLVQVLLKPLSLEDKRKG